MKMSYLLSELLLNASNMDHIPNKKEEKWRFSPLNNYLERSYNKPSFSSPEVSITPEQEHWVSLQDGKVVDSDLPPGVHVKHGLSSLELNFFEDIDLYLYHHYTQQSFVDSSLNIIIQEGVKVSIYHDYSGGKEGFILHSSHIKLEPKGCLSQTQNQTLCAEAVFIFETKVHAGKSSSFKNFSLHKEGEYLHNIFHTDLHYQSEAEITSLLLSQNTQKYIFSCDVEHLASRSKSQILSKQVVRDKSVCVFDANTKISKDTKATQAKQSSHALLLDDSAQVHAKPHLEIYSDDLSASHGCTVGELDQEAIAYLRSRGLSEQKAKEILISAFIHDTLESMENITHKERVMDLLGGYDE